MTKKEMISNLVELEAKYCDLVWYARSRPENIDIKGVREAKHRIEKAHPTEINNLTHGESDWEHGFNSGMLAATRYILELADGDKEFADDLFPFLDT